MINYDIIAKSVKFYNDLGYTRVETPWLVAKEIDDITKPINKISYQIKHNNKCLVASGEQSFLYQYLKGFLPLGKFQTVTPCFRADDFDLLHTKTFIKNELIITDYPTLDNLKLIINDAFQFFSLYLSLEYLEKVETEIGYDIIYKGIEIGSYGIRNCSFLKWIYGTGVAEPRLSTVIKKAHNANT